MTTIERSFLVLTLALALGCASTAVAGDSLDGSSPMLSSVVDAIECAPGGACARGLPADIDAPRFLRIDAKKKTIRGQRAGGDLETKVVPSSNQAGRLILQGTENSRGWTVIIDEQSGDMTIAVADPSVSFVIFGACTGA